MLNPVALAVDIPVGWRKDSLSLCRFIQRLNQSLPAASLAIENGLGILFWTANRKASLLTTYRVHPKYFRSVNKIYSTNLSSRAGGIIGLRPSFDWVAWKGFQFEQTIERGKLYSLQLLDIPFLCYIPPWLLVSCFPCPMTSNPIFFEFYLQISFFYFFLILFISNQTGGYISL